MSARRTWAVARLDLLQNLRRPLYWIWLAILVLFAWMFSTGDARIQSGDADVGGVKAFINSEFAVAQLLSVLTLMVGAFFVAVASGMVVLRDEELRVGGLLHSTPLRPREYVWGKFAAAFGSCVAMLAIHVAASAFFYHRVTGAEEAEFIGPFRLGNYLRPALLLALPLVTVVSGVTFWAGARFRRPILVFLFPVACFLGCVFFVWSWSPSWAPDWANTVLMHVDPSGFRWLNETWLEVDRGVAFYNEEPIAYDAAFLASRAALMALGLLGVVSAARYVARSLRGAAASARDLKRLEQGPERAGAAKPTVVSGSLQGLAMRARRPGFLRGLLAVTRVEFRELRSSPGLYLFVPLIVLQTVMNAVFQPGPFDTELLHTSGFLAVRGVNFLSSLVCLLLLFYTVESLRREEGSGLAQIHSSTPVRTASILFGKALANSLVGVVAIAVTMLTCLVILAIQGQVPLDAGPFVLVWAVILLPTFLVWTSFVALVYSLVRNRYTAYALSLGILMWTAREYWRGDMTWVWNWPLWGTLVWSDMGTFELVRSELVLNRVLALLLTVFFTVLTVRLFPRRQLDATGTLLRLRPLALARRVLWLAPVWVPPVALGLVIDHRVDTGRQGEATEKRLKDYWRKNVATWTDHPVPDISDADVELDLYPERQGFEVKGRFTLTNHHEETLDVIPVTPGLDWRRPDSLAAEEGESEDVGDGGLWTLDGQPFEPEDAAGLLLFRLPEPLERGDSVVLGFHHAGEVPGGVSKNGGGADEFILPSGIVLTSFQPSFVPVLGYNDGIGVDEDNSHDAKEFRPDHYVGDTPGLFGGSWTEHTVRMKVSAPEAFTINCIGVKQSDEVADGRRTVVWESDAPIRFFNVVAGRWDVVHGERDTSIYYHPGHGMNVEAMAQALDAAREHYSAWFHPYPWKELKISEFPALAGYAMGFATNIPFSESIGFLTRADEGDADAPFMVTAHETAHQWWGNLLVPGEGPGANLLSEGMSHFSTLLLFEEVRGEKARIAFATNIENQYAERRVADSERPLVEIDGSRPGDTTVTYDKAGLVFWMLLNHMGRENCLAGLRDFVRHYRSVRDHPVLQDFVLHLRPFAPDPEAYDRFTQQWFFEVVVPRFELEDVERTGSDEEGWTVTLTLENAETGTVPVEVCASAGERFPEDDDEDESAAAPGDAPGGEPAIVQAAELSDEAEEADEPYREVRTTVTLGPGESTEVVLECPFEPERVLVDPDARLLMLKRRRAKHEF